MYKKIISLLTLVSMFFAGFFVLEMRHGSAAAQAMLAERLDKKILSDDIEDAEDEIYVIISTHGEAPADNVIRKRLYKLQNRLDRYEKQYEQYAPDEEGL